MLHLDVNVISTYMQMVEKAYPDEINSWPVISGYNFRLGKYRGWSILVFEHTGNPIPLKIPLEHLTASIVGVDDIGSDTELARQKLSRHLRLSRKDMLIILNSRATNLEQELNAAFKQHETLLNIKIVTAPENKIPESLTVLAAGEQKISDEPVNFKDKPSEKTAAAIKAKPFKEKTQPFETQEKKAAALKEDLKPGSLPFKNKVLIIPGSNNKLKKSICNFLLSLGLQAVDLVEASHLTGIPEQDNIDVITSIFSHCQAVVILLTNDKHDNSLPEKDKEAELKVLPQAELNALFISGVSAGISSKRTIVIGFGNMEPFCGIPGLPIISLDNSLEKRRGLMDRIKLAGCDVKARGKAWHISGDFDMDLQPVFPEKQLSPLAAANNSIIEPQILQPEKAFLENIEHKHEDNSLKKQAETAHETDPESSEQTPGGRSFIESLNILNILKTKKQPPKEKTAPVHAAKSKPGENLTTRLKEPIVQDPADNKPKLNTPEPVTTKKKDKTPVPIRETMPECKGPQTPIKGPAPGKAAGEPAPEEIELLYRIKDLEGKLEALKYRGGKINQRAVVDLEKQIQAEKFRLRTIQQLANVENIKKSYEEYSPKKKKDNQ